MSTNRFSLESLTDKILISQYFFFNRQIKFAFIYLKSIHSAFLGEYDWKYYEKNLMSNMSDIYLNSTSQFKKKKKKKWKNNTLNNGGV